MMSDDEEEGGRTSLPRVVLLVPALVIVSAGLYLLTRNPSATRLVSRETPVPVATATAAPPLPPVPTLSPTPPRSPTPPPTLIQRVAPYQTGYLTGEPVVPPAPGGWLLAGHDERLLIPPGWGAGPPRLELISQGRNQYVFNANGLAPGEGLLLDRSSVYFSIGGHPTTRRGIRVTGVPAASNGATITVDFDSSFVGAFGPTFQLALKGSAGTVIFTTAPFIHYGREPDPIFRLDDTIDEMWYDGRFKMYLPQELPEHTTIQWAASTPGGGGNLWNWLLPTKDGGWTSLVMAERADCDSTRGQGARHLIDCFGPMLAQPPNVEKLRFGRYEWQLARAGSEWAIAGDVEGTLILYIGIDRDTIITAAASTHP